MPSTLTPALWPTFQPLIPLRWGAAPGFPPKPLPTGCRAGSSGNKWLWLGLGGLSRSQECLLATGSSGQRPSPSPPSDTSCPGRRGCGPSTPGSEDSACWKNQKKPTYFPPTSRPSITSTHTRFGSVFSRFPRVGNKDFPKVMGSSSNFSGRCCYGVTRPCALHCVPSAPDAGDKGHGEQAGAVHQPRYLMGASNLVRVSYRVEANFRVDASYQVDASY